MHRIWRTLAACLFVARLIAPNAAGATAGPRPSHPKGFQETGFLNRTLEVRGISYHFQVYLPEEWRRNDHKLWPIILFLHGRGERGEEGMWQTQIGLPEAVRDHPERWPFIIVMPQCPQGHYWTDPDMMDMAMHARSGDCEFNADPARTYLTGLSLGGYGAWELARSIPNAGLRWRLRRVESSGVMRQSARHGYDAAR